MNSICHFHTCRDFGNRRCSRLQLTQFLVMSEIRKRYVLDVQTRVTCYSRFSFCFCSSKFDCFFFFFDSMELCLLSNKFITDRTMKKIIDFFPFSLLENVRVPLFADTNRMFFFTVRGQKCREWTVYL